MTIDVRTIEATEIPAWLDANTTAFLERPADPAGIAASVVPHWDVRRVRAAFDGDRIVGTFRSFPSELTVPGGAVLPMAAIAGVGVLPTHRRRGVLRGLIAAEHAEMDGRGEIVSGLYASEYPIYGRFGYGVACRQAVWQLDARVADFVAPASGRVELATPDAATVDLARGVFERIRPRQPGSIPRRDTIWELHFGLRPDPWGDGWRGFVAIHRDDDGDVDGYARYHAESKWVDNLPGAVLHVDDLQAVTPAAEDALWRFLAEIDWVGAVRAERRSPSERLPWILTNQRAARMVEQADGLFVRLHDVPAALTARTYAGEGSLVIESVDPSESGGRQRVRLEAGRDGARATSTDATPDLTVHASALGAAYLGGTPLSLAAIATGGADEGRPGALAEADRLFRTADEPWCSTFF